MLKKNKVETTSSQASKDLQSYVLSMKKVQRLKNVKNIQEYSTMYKYSFNDWPGILAGCILGDGYVKINRIIISHTTPQRDYVVFKHNWFKGLKLSTKTRMDYWTNTNLGPYQYSEVTVIMPDNRLVGLTPYELVHTLNPFGLLLWWLDDGSLTVHVKDNRNSVSRFGYLNTQAHDYNTQIQLRQALFERFGIETTIHKDCKRSVTYYRLYLNATNMRKLIDLVRDIIPYIPSTMLYKLNMDYRPSRISTSESFVKLYNF